MTGTAADREKYKFRGFIGPNGSGKTFLGTEMANKTSNRQVRVRCNQRDGTLAEGAIICRTYEELRRQMSVPGPNLICWDGSVKYGYEMAFKIAATLCLNEGEWLLFGDEAHLYCGNRNVKPSGFMVPLLGQHYHARIHFFWTAFRLVDLHPDWRTQTWQKHHFYSPNSTDKKTLAGDVGGALVADLKIRNQQKRYSYVLEDRIKDAVLMPPWPAKRPYPKLSKKKTS